eukprot:gb/GECH01009449.1/.p1 GENE.gb/GECH01009449.1/~~gb/GECH01009449.1/.p1  ORF type:complete len:118 (+),score=18.52 gb/GECH01009449.1/:1-354(+)
MSLFPDPEQLENKTHGNRPSQNARSSGMWKKAMKSVARSIYRNPKKVFLGAILGYVFIQGDKLPEDMMLEIPFSQFENLEQNPIKPRLLKLLNQFVNLMIREKRQLFLLMNIRENVI